MTFNLGDGLDKQGINGNRQETLLGAVSKG